MSFVARSELESQLAILLLTPGTLTQGLAVSTAYHGCPQCEPVDILIIYIYSLFLLNSLFCQKQQSGEAATIDTLKIQQTRECCGCAYILGQDDAQVSLNL